MTAIARRPSPAVLALLVSVSVAGAWAVYTPDTADLAAQSYRAQLFATQGFLLWDNNWYGGHYLPGYSLLFPPLAAVLGLRLTGVVLVPPAACLFALILERTGSDARGRGAAWFAAALLGELVIGRLTFLLGTTLALGAVALLVHRRPWAAAILAAGTASASPIAGAFLLLIAVALALHRRRRDAWLLAAGALAPLLGTALLTPEGGVQPFSALSFVAAAGLTLAFLGVVRRQPGLVRTSAALYLAAIVVCYLIPNPVGSNIARLGVLVAGPVLLTRTSAPRSLLARATLLAMVTWQLFGPVTETVKSFATPSRASIYASLLDQLALRGAESGRVEIVPTATRWEVARVAPRFALARGWESQLDRQRNPLFYGAARLDSATYGRWLDANAVRFVVLPSVPLERWGRKEGQLVGSGLPYLRRVWQQGPWTLFRVTNARSLIRGPAVHARLTHDTVSFDATGAGDVVARVRYTPRWQVTVGHACVVPTAGMTRVRVTAPGPVQLTATLTGAQRCPP